MIYLGALGRLVPIRCASSQQVGHGDRYSTLETLEGRVKAQVRPVRRREWSVGFGDLTSAEDASKLLEFVEGAWGSGPFRFVPTEAPTTNMCTPAQSVLHPSAGTETGYGARFGGPMLTEDGWIPSSIVNPDPSRLVYVGVNFIPVMPGTTITVAAYVLGIDASTQVYFFDNAGGQVGNFESARIGTADAAVRAAVTVEVPEGAATARIYARRSVQVGRPSLTWTDEVMPWITGRGCEKAILRDVSESLVYVKSDKTYESMAFTVTEVG